MSRFGICPACESSNGHSLSCELLSARESSFDSEWCYAQDESDSYDDSWVQEAYDELDSREDLEFDDWEPDYDENFQALVALKARIQRRESVH